MGFNKFDPHKPEEPPERGVAHRRAMLLKYGWWISTAYAALGFGLIAYWALT